MIAIIALNQDHARHFAHQNNMNKDDWRFISSVEQMRGLPPTATIMLLPDWWKRGDAKEIEKMVETHDERYKKQKRNF